VPIYEYQCKNCQHRVELIQGFDDAPATDCPQCQAPALTKLLSAPAFHLKGSGWYVTDFKNPPAQAAPVKSGTETAATAPATAGGADNASVNAEAASATTTDAAEKATSATSTAAPKTEASSAS